jgi:hypothetical protein
MDIGKKPLVEKVDWLPHPTLARHAKHEYGHIVKIVRMATNYM